MKGFKLLNKKVRFSTDRMTAVKVLYLNEEDGYTMINDTIIHSRDSVAVIVMNDNNEIAIIRQFRHSTGEFYWEIPSGVMDEEENVIQATNRIASELAQVNIKDIRQVSYGPNLLDISKSDENFEVVLAKVDNIIPQKSMVNGSAKKIIKWMPIEKVYERMKKQIKQGKTFMGKNFMSGHSLYALLTYKFTED